MTEKPVGQILTHVEKEPQTVKRFIRMESAALLALVFATALSAQNAQAASPSDLYARAKRAIASGNVVPERDLAPLIAVLRGPSSEEDLRSAIYKIETLADARGSSPEVPATARLPMTLRA